jgi:hypothetical protein
VSEITDTTRTKNAESISTDTDRVKSGNEVGRVNDTTLFVMSIVVDNNTPKTEPRIAKQLAMKKAKLPFRLRTNELIAPSTNIPIVKKNKFCICILYN